MQQGRKMDRYLAAGYTHRINLHRIVPGLGWMFQTYPTTADAVKRHLHRLTEQQLEGVVRNIEVISLV